MTATTIQAEAWSLGPSRSFAAQDAQHRDQSQKPWDTHLYPQTTRGARADAAPSTRGAPLNEIDLLDRMKPLAGAFENQFSAFGGMAAAKSRSAAPRFEEGVTLSSKKYPSFADMAKRDRYADR